MASEQMLALSQRIVQPELPRYGMEFSLGICAADRPNGIDELLNLIDREQYPVGYVLKRIIIVASGLDQSALNPLRMYASQRNNTILIEEPTRKGKAEAINRIIEQFTGEFLVLVNSDALPRPGAISKLLEVIASDDQIGLASASPMICDGAGLTGAVMRLMWEVHNECLATLNEESMNNHCCDELIVIRSEALQTLPEDTVNDGAFLAGTAYRAGFRVEFCKDATVRIDVPDRFIDLMRQRRRIVYGHRQIHRALGESPRTLESMLFSNPKLGLSILVRALADFPELFLVLPVAVVGEFVSATYAAFDSLTSKTKHIPWDRVGRRA